MSADLGDPPRQPDVVPPAGPPRPTADFVRLFTDSARRIFAYILVLLPNEDAAQDVFQETSVTLWERFEQFELGTDFYAWAKQVAYYKVLHYRSQQQREKVFLADALLAQLASDAGDLSDTLEARHRALADCYAKLAKLDRRLVELRYEPHATTEQVAATVGRSVHQVYRSLRKIHEALFDCVSRALAKEAD